MKNKEIKKEITKLNVKVAELSDLSNAYDEIWKELAEFKKDFVKLTKILNDLNIDERLHSLHWRLKTLEKEEK